VLAVGLASQRLLLLRLRIGKPALKGATQGADYRSAEALRHPKIIPQESNPVNLPARPFGFAEGRLQA